MAVAGSPLAGARQREGPWGCVCVLLFQFSWLCSIMVMPLFGLSEPRCPTSCFLRHGLCELGCIKSIDTLRVTGKCVHFCVCEKRIDDSLERKEQIRVAPGKSDDRACKGQLLKGRFRFGLHITLWACVRVVRCVRHSSVDLHVSFLNLSKSQIHDQSMKQSQVSSLHSFHILPLSICVFPPVPLL